MSLTAKHPVAAVLSALAMTVFFLQAFTAMQTESDTWDEGLALASDALRIIKNDWRIADYAPPLHTWLNTPAFRLIHPEFPPDSLLAESESRYGSAFLFASNAPERILLFGRLTVLLSVCLMGIFLHRWASRLGGPWAGAAALWLIALEPTVLAHSRIAVWDALCMSYMFIAAYSVWRWTRSPSWTSSFFAGIAVGLALISKYTSAVLLPALACGVALYPFVRENDPWRSFRRTISVHRVWQSALIVLFAAVVVVVSYWPAFKPFEYFRGMAQIYSVNVMPESGRYQYYLFGEIFEHPQKLYYPLSFLIKTPIPVLALIAFVLAFRKRCLLSRADTLFILLPVAGLFWVSAYDRYNVCIRRILPVYPFLILIAAQAVSYQPAGIFKKIFLAVCVGWLGWVAVQTYPNHLSYFNEFVGGPTAGTKCLDECNVDWGQGLPRLAEYLKSRDIPEVRMASEDAGPFNRAAYYGIKYQPVSNEEYDSPLPAVYALSAHRVVWLKKISKRLGKPTVDWMERYQPAGHVGHSIFIYDFRSP